MKSQIEDVINQTVKKLYEVDLDSRLEHPKDDRFGDYATAVALNIAQAADADPLEIAHQIVAYLKNQKSKIKDIVNRIEVAEPGFVNFWLNPEALVKEVNEVNKRKDGYGSSAVGKGRTVVIDYSSPNIAKRFGIGHLRSTVIGQALYNLDKFHGYQVIGDNHLGDWGTQFGALIASIKSSRLKIQNLTVDDLEELYVDFHQDAEKDPKLIEEARSWFKKLEEGDKEARSIWKSVVDVSLAEFNRIYNLLGVKFDYTYGESFYEDKMPAVIEEVRARGLSRRSEGAEIVEFPSTSSGQVLPPAILVKSDGATTYFTRDLATIKFRLKEFAPQFITYEVGADQKLHFQQLFATAKKLGWGETCYLFHVAHGLIRMAFGKMSTRRGQTVKLEDVLEEATLRAKKLTGGNDAISKAVGVGAIKYFDLSHQPQTDIIFDWEKLFLLEGNSGPYLQYTYARARSVLRKAKLGDSVRTRQLDNQTFVQTKLQPSVSEDSTTEQPLLRWLYRFPEVLEEAAENYSPNLICNYLFELAQRFNSFYDKAPIIKAQDDVRNLRLVLTAATAQVLKNGLSILGIETPEKL